MLMISTSIVSRLSIKVISIILLGLIDNSHILCMHIVTEDRKENMFVTIFYNLMSSKRNNTMGAKQMQEVHLLSAREARLMTTGLHV